MSFADYFSPDYRTARDKFLTVAGSAGARIETFENPALGPDGKSVFTDVALIGNETADRVLLANSATHGVEGFCGSGAMVGWLREELWRDLAENTRVVLIHAINPHGFAWVRRVTEDNVDLNRNFIDHSGARPTNPEYDGLHPVIAPEKWNAKTRAACEQAFQEYAKEHGAFALQSVVTGGQYGNPDGVFYGGDAPTWSNRTFHTILEQFVKGASRVASLDFHTGLGPYGTAELIGGPGSGNPVGDRLRSIYGRGLFEPPMEIVPPAAKPSAKGGSSNGHPTSAALTGTTGGCVRRVLNGSAITGATVEFGTYPVRDVLYALIADNWLHLYGDPDSKMGRAIKANTRLRLYPDEESWKELVWVRARQILRRAAEGLAEN